MKIRKFIAALGIIMILPMAACGQKSGENVTAASSAESVDASAESVLSSSGAVSASEDPVMNYPLVDDGYKTEDVMTLADYKGLDITETIVDFTDQEVEDYIKSTMDYEVVEDTTVKDQDSANIDYEGKIDGKAFDGGTASGYDLVIGSGTFIPGFEDQLIGMKAGETKDIKVTFPEDYGSADLAGKDAVFTVTVNKISRKPELTGAWVMKTTDKKYTTVDEYRKVMRSKMEEQARIGDSMDQETQIWQQLTDATVFKALSRSDVNEQLQQIQQNVEQMARQYNVDVNTYIASAGMDQVTYESQKELAARLGAEVTMVKKAVIEKEKIDEKSPEYKQAIEELQESTGLSEEDLKTKYGEDTLKQYGLEEAAFIRVKSYAKVKTVHADSSGNEIQSDADSTASESLNTASGAVSSVSQTVSSAS